MEKVTTRPLHPTDAEAVATLSASFGYPVTPADLRSRITAFADSKDRLTLAAILQDTVVGWIDAAIEHRLQSEPVVVISGLVVREDRRGQGIGRQLCKAAEEWARQIGIRKVRVRSQQKRLDAHRFYQRDGYTQVKISAVFEKQLPDHP